MFYRAAYLIQLLSEIFTTLLFARAVLSWFAGNAQPQIRKIYDVLVKITEPVVDPCRKLMARFFNTGPIDFSVLVTMILVSVVARILVRVLLILA